MSIELTTATPQTLSGIRTALKTYEGMKGLAVYSSPGDIAGSLKLYSTSSSVTALNIAYSPSTWGSETADPIILVGGRDLTSLSFSYCGYLGFSLSDTGELNSLTSLSFNYCSYYYNFSISDVSGLTSLTSLLFSYCGYIGGFSITDSITLLPESKALLILDAVDSGSSIGIGPITLRSTGFTTLTSVSASLQSKGYTVNILT